MNVKEILIEWLKEHGYDGLYDSGNDCACQLSDLCPCDCGPWECEAGVFLPLTSERKSDGFDFVIGPKEGE